MGCRVAEDLNPEVRNSIGLDVLIIHPLLRLFEDIETSRLIAPVPPLLVRSGALRPYFNSHNRRSYKMKKDDFEPARIIGKPGPQSDQGKGSDKVVTESPAEPGSTAPGAATGAAVGEGVSMEKTQTTPLMAILNRFTGMVAPGTTNPDWLYSMSKQGVLDGFRGRPSNEVDQDIQFIVVAALSNTLMFIGYYLLAVFFDNDASKAFAKSPKKQTSLNELASRRACRSPGRDWPSACGVQPWTWNSERWACIWTHSRSTTMRRISNLPRLEDQIALAQEVEARKLTPGEVLDRVQKLLGKSSSEDKRLGKSVMKNVGDLLRLATDAQTQDFFKDRGRVKAAFGPTETTALLGSIRELREEDPCFRSPFRDLEPTLVDLLVEYTHEDKVVDVHTEGDPSVESTS